MANLTRVCSIALLVADLSGASVFAQSGAKLSLNGENDFVMTQDRHYTHGMHLFYDSADYVPDQDLPALLRPTCCWPALGYTARALKWGAGLGQEIYTPDDLDDPDVIPDDRPFAGWLFGSVSWQRRGVNGRRLPVMEEIRLDLGVIGPPALGEETQKLAHGKAPAGWDNQLDTEPGFALRYDRRYQFSTAAAHRRWRCDLIPRWGGSAGNVDIHVSGGGMLRVGLNMPDEFAFPSDQDHSRWGFYLFGSAEGRWVIRNIFLDGNTFQSSHHVAKEPVVAEAKLGISLVFRRWEFTYAHVFLTEEFKDQSEPDIYGSATVSYRF